MGGSTFIVLFSVFTLANSARVLFPGESQQENNQSVERNSNVNNVLFGVSNIQNDAVETMMKYFMNKDYETQNR